MNKKRILIVFVSLFFIFMLFSDGYAQHIRKKLACFPFIPKTLRAIGDTENIMSTLLNDIDRTGLFELVERKKIENIMDLENMRADDRSKTTFLSIGNKYALDFMLAGTVDTTDNGVILELELFDVKGKNICLKDIYNLSGDVTGRKIQDIASIIVKKTKECSGSDVAISSLALSPPTQIDVTGSTDAIKIKWGSEKPHNILGYKIYKSAKEEGPFNQIATTTIPSYTDGNLKLNETYYYKVKAISITGNESDFSETIKGQTSTAPYAPIFLSARPDIKSAHLKWVPRPGSEKHEDLIVAGFRIYRKSFDEKEFSEVAQVGKETKEYIDKELKDGTEYTYAITAFNEKKSESHLSTKLTIKTLQKMDPVKTLNNKIRHTVLTWEPVKSDFIEGYRIYRSTEEYGSYTRIAQISNPETTSYKDKELEDNKTYWYRITAYNKENIETDLSEPASAKTRDKPPVPHGLTAQATGPKKVLLTWKLIDNPEDEIKGYKIYRSNTESGEYRLINDVREDKSSYVDDDFNIKENTVFYYRVSSFNSANAESKLSSPVSVEAIPEPKK